MLIIQAPIWAMIACAFICGGIAGCGGVPQRGGSPEPTVATPPSPIDDGAGIVGTWRRPEWALYHTLYFESDSTAVFDNHIDSLYRYVYSVRSDTLVLLYDSAVVHRSPILELTEDSLVLGGWPDLPGTFGYARAKNEPGQPARPR